MKQIKNFLKAFIVVAALSTNCFSQASVTNSIPNDGCRTTATGSLTVNYSYNSVSRWEELEFFEPSTYVYVRTVGTTSKTFNYSTSQPVVYYRAKLLGGTNLYSQIVTIRNFPPPVTGTLSGAPTYYESPGTGTLTLSGYSGPITKWQQSTNGTTWTDIANTSDTYSIPNLTQSTYFRAFVDGTAPCTPMPSNSVMIYPPGVISSSVPEIGCRTSAHGLLTVSNYSSVVRWEEGYMQGSTFVTTNIINSTNSYLNYSTGSPVTFYRAKLAAGVYSTVIGIENHTPPEAGTLSGAATFTEGATGSLTLSGYSGQIIKWQYSTDGSSWYDIAHTSNSYNYNNLAQTTHYRAVVDNGICASVNSNSVTITVIAPPPVSNSIPNDGCRTSANGTLTVSGYPSVVQWEEGEMLGATFHPVYTYNVTQPSYGFSTSVPYTYYRAKIATNVYSAVVMVRNFYPPVSGTLSGSITSIGDQGGNPVLNGSLTLNGHSGQIVKWQSSVNGSTWTDITNTTNTHNFSNLTQPTYFRVELGTAGCSNIFTNTVFMKFPEPVGGILSGAATYLATGTGSVTLNNYTGKVIKWQSSVDGSTWTDIAHTSSTYSYTNLTQSAYYRAVVGYPGWPNVNSSQALINVTTLTGSTSVYRDGTASLSLSGINLSLEGWEYSIDGGTNWISEACVNQTFRLPISANTSFRVKLNPGAHSGITYSNVHAVTINTSSYSQENPVTGVAGQNYVREQRVAVAGITTPEQVDALTSTSKHEAFSYADGLGRGVQTIAAKASPLQKDLISFSVYDKYGMSSKQYLPYVAATGTGSYTGSFLTDQTAFYANGTSDKIEDTSFPFAESKFDNSPLFRVTEQGSVGTDWQIGSGHTVTTVTTSNADNEVRQFISDGTSSGFYPANELVVTEVTDNDGRKRQAVTDKFGRTVLTKVQLDETIDGTSVPWLETYYIHYTSGEIRYVISPKGVNALKNGSWSFTQSIKDQYVYEFIYDTFGRMVEKKTPGQAPVYYCYDVMNRLILVQDGNIRAQNKWFYLKYDRLGRPVMQGLYTNNTHTTRTAVQTNVIDPLFSSPTVKHYEERGTAAHGYTNQVFPTSDTEVLAVNYFGSYDFDYDGEGDFSYTAQSLTGEGTPGTTIVGKPTGSKRLIMGTSTWLSEYYFYDADGRVIQMRSNNHLSATIDNLVTIVYDFEGKKTLQKTFHKTSSNTTTVINRFVYDHMGRAKEIWQSNNALAEQLLAQYHYNELGQLVDKKLHDTGSSQFLQSVDFRYNIQGWLKSINNSQLTNDAVANDDTGDYFGMELLYSNVESGLNNSALYSGNISSIKWKGPDATSGAADVKSYKFSYDKSNKLKTAAYLMKGLTAWDQDAGAQNESMTYDHNGNILTLQRYQKDNGTAQLVDNLTYAYNTGNGNSLEKVTDAVTAPEGRTGFDNGNSGTNIDYTYDATGNLTKDENKGISAIAYNVLGKPSQITFTDGRVISYTYDAIGSKLKMSVTLSGTTTTTDYVGGFVYENNAFSFFGSPEGRVVNKSGTLEYQYAIADHQGNTRVVFSSVAPAPESGTATIEPVNQTNERATFLKYDDVRKINAAIFDHTNNGSTNYSIRLSGTASETYGLARSLSVAPGDKVKAEVFAKYVDPQSSNWTTALTNLMSAITSASAGTVFDGEGYGTTSGQTIPYVGALDHGSQTGSAPKAYLNWLVFDKNFNPIISKSGFMRMSETAKETGSDVNHEKLEMSEIEITEPGFVYIYLSNENGTPIEVYFDDFNVTHTKTNIIQYNEYYPFGLQTSNSWTRENSSNNALYNSGTELNNTTGIYETMFRGYDPTLGRFMQVDPLALMAHNESPYGYASNNPVLFNDPWGLLTQAQFDNIINGLWNSPFGGTWSEDAGYHEFGSGGEASSWASAYSQQQGAGGGGSIQATYGVTSTGTAFSSASQTMEAYKVIGITGYKYVADASLGGIPLTKSGLVDLYQETFGPLTGGTLEDAVGTAFENTYFDWMLGVGRSVRQNNIPFPSAARGTAAGINNVVPDGTNDVTVTRSQGRYLTTTTYPNASFYEVKAKSGFVSLSTSNYQILGLLDALRTTAPGAALLGYANMTFVTTADVRISPSVINYASSLGIFIFQQIAFVNSSGEIGFSNPMLLNPNKNPVKRGYSLPVPLAPWFNYVPLRQ